MRLFLWRYKKWKIAFFSAQLANTAALISIGYNAKKGYIFVPKTRRVLEFLSVLQRAHIICQYRVVLSKRGHELCRVSLFLDSAHAAKIRIIQTTHKKTSISLKALRAHVAQHGTLLIVSTSGGLLLGTEACARGVSGTVVACILI